MTPRGRAGWLPSALLLLQLPGCLSLSGPSRVTGIMGGSLRVECRYQEGFGDDNKFWCTPPWLWKIVETRESEREVRRGHGSIRDCPVSLTFKVTLESLREEDAGRYRCGIDVPFSTDPAFQVEVSVTPAPAAATSPEKSTGSPGSPTTLPVPNWSTTSGQKTPDPGRPPQSYCVPGALLWMQAPAGGSARFLLGRAHFLLLVFLKVPLLLGMLGAALWVRRPSRS